jgi:hypothetical protein
MFYQQGDVIVKEVSEVKGNKITHLTLAQGSKTGHNHSISKGDAELYDNNGILYLKVDSKKAVLSHQEHKPIDIKKGNYQIVIVREYDHFEEEARNVAD